MNTDLYLLVYLANGPDSSSGENLTLFTCVNLGKFDEPESFKDDVLYAVKFALEKSFPKYTVTSDDKFREHSFYFDGVGMKGTMSNVSNLFHFVLNTSIHIKTSICSQDVDSFTTTYELSEKMESGISLL